MSDWVCPDCGVKTPAWMWQTGGAWHTSGHLNDLELNDGYSTYVRPHVYATDEEAPDASCVYTEENGERCGLSAEDHPVAVVPA